jgi:hypothetical protein
MVIVRKRARPAKAATKETLKSSRENQQNTKMRPKKRQAEVNQLMDMQGDWEISLIHQQLGRNSLLQQQQDRNQQEERKTQPQKWQRERKKWPQRKQWEEG